MKPVGFYTFWKRFKEIAEQLNKMSWNLSNVHNSVRKFELRHIQYPRLPPPTNEPVKPVNRSPHVAWQTVSYRCWVWILIRYFLSCYPFTLFSAQIVQRNRKWRTPWASGTAFDQRASLSLWLSSSCCNSVCCQGHSFLYILTSKCSVRSLISEIAQRPHPLIPCTTLLNWDHVGLLKLNRLLQWISIFLS